MSKTDQAHERKPLVTIVAIPPRERKSVPASEVRRAVGGAVTRSRDDLLTHFPLAMTAATQYVLTRQVALNILAGCCEVDSQLTVRELYELLDADGR